MYARNIYPALEAHLSKKQVTVITGMRRVGKSTAVKHLLKCLDHDNILYLDCERVEIRALFSRPNYEEIKNEMELMGFDFSTAGVIAIDEIQLSADLPSIVKYLYDTYQTKFVVTGSSSYYLKNRFSESLAGRKRIFELYPLSFKEFLVFKEVWKDKFNEYAGKTFQASWYNQMKNWYQEYLTYGGFPEVVLETHAADKMELLRDIINSYIELDVKLLADYSQSEDLYKLTKLLAARVGNKIDHSKLGSISGINRQKIASYVQLFEQTYLICQIAPFTRNIDKEIAHQKKVYFADTGLLHALAGNLLSSGQVFENAVAAQLKAFGDLNYYQRKSGQEIDFILNGDTAIEVKETAVVQDKNTLLQRASSIDLQENWLIGLHPAPNGFTDFIWAGTLF
ncbi:ATP-binding protein [Parapedobacter tibetensis]|uniref:ATP-binding protein n=1 Tax=Parapedobacter tibetensis TaxID=2972951 RepID=UPI00214DC53F|nr:ATP-binding protein [Parapedobacter tibetensis]